MNYNVMPDKAHVTYRVKTGNRWSKEVIDLAGVAGTIGKPITDIAIKVSYGSCKYRVHVKNGKWLPWVTGYNINDYNNGYAGNGKEIDAIQIYYYTPKEWVEKFGYYMKIRYRVAPIGKNFYNYQYDTETTNGQDGYAGSFGKSIDRFQVEVDKFSALGETYTDRK